MPTRFVKPFAVIALSFLLFLSACRGSMENMLDTEPASTTTSVMATPISATPTTATDDSPYRLLYQAGEGQKQIFAWRSGQPKTLIAPGDLLHGQPISPDQKRMVIDTKRTARDPHSVEQMAVLDLTDGNIQPINLRTKEYTIHWSPDGALLLYLTYQNDLSQLVVYDFATGDNTTVLEMEHIFLAAGWSADGSEIAFVANVDGQYDLFVLDAQSLVVRQLTDTPDIETAAVWSPMSNTLLIGVTAYSEHALLEPGPYHMNSLFLIDSQGQSEHLGNYDKVLSFSLAWSTDGDSVAFSDNGRLCILELKTAQTECPLENIPPFDAYFAAFGDPPAWSPDDRWIAFRAIGFRDSSNCQGVYALELETQQVVVIDERCETGPVYWVAE
jgi:Tol biopolymer transport system component